MVRKSALFLLIVIVSGFLLWPVGACAESYPRDGHFKELSFGKDRWYFVDTKNWYIKAPDKWVHFMGSYALSEVSYRVVRNKFWAGVIAVGLGLVKEYDDAYREGWSRRDIYVNVGGVASSLILPENARLLAYYDDDSLIFKLSFIID